MVYDAAHGDGIVAGNECQVVEGCGTDKSGGVRNVVVERYVALFEGC